MGEAGGISFAWLSGVGVPLLSLIAGTFVVLIRRVDTCRAESHRDMEMLRSDMLLRLNEGRDDRLNLRAEVASQHARAEDQRGNLLVCISRLATRDDTKGQFNEIKLEMREMEARITGRFNGKA